VEEVGRENFGNVGGFSGIPAALRRYAGDKEKVRFIFRVT
jgi:hypothetical protein